MRELVDDEYENYLRKNHIYDNLSRESLLCVSCRKVHIIEQDSGIKICNKCREEINSEIDEFNTFIKDKYDIVYNSNMSYRFFILLFSERARLMECPVKNKFSLIVYTENLSGPWYKKRKVLAFIIIATSNYSDNNNLDYIGYKYYLTYPSDYSKKLLRSINKLAKIDVYFEYKDNWEVKCIRDLHTKKK